MSVVGDSINFYLRLTKRLQLSLPNNLLCLIRHRSRRTQVVVVQVIHLNRRLRGERKQHQDQDSPTAFHGSHPLQQQYEKGSDPELLLN